MLTAPILLSLADDHAERAAAHGSHALSSIVFAAAAFEGFLSEATWMARRHQEQDRDVDPVAVRLATVISKVEEARGQPSLMVIVWYLACDRGIPNRGTQPHQDLGLLWRLRNGILHPKSQGFPEAEDDRPVNPPPLVSALVTAGALPRVPEIEMIPLEGVDPTATTYQPWFWAVQSASVAEWAARTGRKGVKHLIDVMPGGLFKEQLQRLWSHLNDATGSGDA